MAAPAYTEDLTDIDTGLAETTTGYAAYGGGGAGLGAGPDYAMQGTNCVDKQVTNAEKGILYDKGSGITMGAGDHVFIWLFNATPGVTDSLVNRGAVVNIGNSTTAFVKYHVEGNNTYGAGGRVGKCYCINQTVQTANTGSIPYRTLVGSPNGTLQFFGAGLNTTASVKAANMGLDATRYGTGAYITAGEVANPATFAGFAAQNDAVANRWGILTDLGGSYELQGAFVVGRDNTGTATLAYFEDSDVSITLVDTPHSSPLFTKFIFDHASTIVKWTNITIKTLGTNNKGSLSVSNAATQFDLVGGSFTGFGFTTLRDSCAATGTTWRDCQVVALIGGATLTDCTFDAASSIRASSTDDLEDISGCHFIGGNTTYAVDLGSIGGGTMTWDNTSEGYDVGVSGSPVTPTTTGNETIYVSATSGTITINVAAGATIPSIRSAGATVNVVAGQVTTKVIVQHPDGSLITTLDANVLVKAAEGGPLAVGTQIIKGFTDVNGEIQDTRSLASNQPVTGWVRKSTASPYYKQFDLVGTIDNANGLTLNAQMVDDE